MKKILNIILGMGILLQNILIVMPVNALETDPETISILAVKQGTQDLNIVEGVYQTVNFEAIGLKYKINNIDITKEYEIIITQNDIFNSRGGQISAKDLLPDQYGYLYASKENALNKYEINLYEVKNGVNELLDTKIINVNFTDFEELDYKNSELFLEKVFQGGNEVIGTSTEFYYNYELNDIEDITFKLKGENFANDVNYRIYYNNDGKYLIYTGEQLNAGIDMTIPNSKSTSIRLSAAINSIGWSSIFLESIYVYLVETEGIYNFTYNNDSTIENYNSTITYKNYEAVSVEEIPEENNYGIDYVVYSKYHNAENPINIRVEGRNYADKNYKAVINIKKGGTSVYSNTKNINGLLINGGYNIELESFTSYIPEDYDETDEYIVVITLGNTTKTLSYVYREEGTLEANLFYSNGQKTVIRNAGWDGNYGNGILYDISNKTFSNNAKMYFYYLAKNLSDITNYNYTLEYGEVTYDGEEETSNYETVSSGTMTGKDLNTKGIMLEIDNNENYERPSYRFTIKNGSKIVYYNTSELNLNDNPTLTTVGITANNKTIYMQMSDYSYLATRNAPISISVNGIDFDENTVYNCLVYNAKVLDDDTQIDESKEVTFTGKQLNEGKAIIPISSVADNVVKRYIGIEVKDNEDIPISWGGIEVKYVQSSDYFPSEIPYIIDDGKDLIKSIKSNTNVNTFKNSIDVNNNGSVKIYDKTGSIEQNGVLGTGMIARVLDEFNRSLLDLEVAVKGDVSGDGLITITDLVKTKRDVADAEKLTGAYAVAGDITGSGSIGITDLVKISRDVADIEEID